jgi:hypothetical protein
MNARTIPGQAIFHRDGTARDFADVIVAGFDEMI